MEKKENCTIKGIVCDAKNCIHHTENDRCTAEQVEVGYNSSKCCSETACTTFAKKD